MIKELARADPGF